MASADSSSKFSVLREPRPERKLSSTNRSRESLDLRGILDDELLERKHKAEKQEDLDFCTRGAVTVRPSV